MSAETLVSTIVTASITGAGLLIAIYALITPISSKILEKRVDLLKKKKEKFDKIKDRIDSESSKDDIDKLKTLATEIKEIKTFPRYLGPLVAIDLVLFTMNVLFGSIWLLSVVETQLYFLVGLFVVAVFGFLAVCVYAIQDVYSAMQGEFEDLKKQKEAVEEARKSALFYKTAHERIASKTNRNENEKIDS